MAGSTYSPLKIELIPTGAQVGVWGATTNVNLGTAIEQALVGRATLVTADFTTNVATLVLVDSNAPQNARAFSLLITATLTGAGTVNVPAINKPYLVYNNSVGGFAITIKVAGQTGVSVPNGRKAFVYNDGVDVGEAINYFTSLNLGTPLTPANGGTGGNLTTNYGGTGNTAYTAGDLSYYASGTAFTKLPIAAATQILTSSGTAPQWTNPASITVGNATTVSNLQGGVTNQILYQAAPSTTAFITAPSTVGSFLQWSGSSFIWNTSVGSGSVTLVNGSGGTTGMTLTGGPITTTGTLTLGGTLAGANGGTGLDSTNLLAGYGCLPQVIKTPAGAIVTSNACSAPGADYIPISYSSLFGSQWTTISKASFLSGISSEENKMYYMGQF